MKGDTARELDIKKSKRMSEIIIILILFVGNHCIDDCGHHGELLQCGND